MVIFKPSSTGLLFRLVEGEKPPISDTLSADEKLQLLLGALELKLDSTKYTTSVFGDKLLSLICPLTYLNQDLLANLIRQLRFEFYQPPKIPLEEVQHRILIELLFEAFRRTLAGTALPISETILSSIRDRYREDSMKRCYRTIDVDHLIALCDRLSGEPSWFSSRDELGVLLSTRLNTVHRDVSGTLEAMAKLRGHQINKVPKCTTVVTNQGIAIINQLPNILKAPEQAFMGSKNLTMWFDPWNTNIIKCIVLSVGSSNAFELRAILLDIIELAFTKIQGCGYLIEPLGKAAIASLASTPSCVGDLRALQGKTKIKALRNYVERAVGTSDVT
jgi:hypothetical protein